MEKNEAFYLVAIQYVCGNCVFLTEGFWLLLLLLLHCLEALTHCRVLSLLKKYVACPALPIYPFTALCEGVRMCNIQYRRGALGIYPYIYKIYM